MNKIMLVDGNSIANRAFYALPLLSNSKGTYTNAIYGFMNIFFKFYSQEKPDLIRVAFDLKAPTFRHKLYKEYKGQRKAMPDEFRMQMPIIKEVLTLMNIPIMELEGYEADDLIGTMAKTYEKEGYEVIIISGDRDLLQLATDKICIKMPKTKGGKTEVESYYQKDIEEKMGVKPLEYIDVKALMGDASDNIKGVPKVGEKTAFKLIQTYKSLDGIYSHLDELKGAVKKNLEENKDAAYESQFLVTIKIDVPMDTNTPVFGPIYNKNLEQKLIELETKSLLEKVKRDFENINMTSNSPSNATTNKSQDSLNIAGDFEEEIYNISVLDLTSSGVKAPYVSISNKVVQITTKEELDKKYNDIKKNKTVILKPFIEDGNLVAIALKDIKVDSNSNDKNNENDKIFKEINLDKIKDEKDNDKVYFIQIKTMLNDSQISQEELLDFILKLYKEDEILKISYDAKKCMRYLIKNTNMGRTNERIINNYYDLMLAYYVRTLSNGPYQIEDFASCYLAKLIKEEKEVFGVYDKNGKLKTKERVSILDLDREKLDSYLIEQMDIIINGYVNINKDFELNNEKKELFSKIENPLCYVLAKMESAGMMIDMDEMRRYQKDINEKVASSAKAIYDMAGREFNISSPKQLGEVLFVDLGIESKKKTKTGMSTSAETLEKIKDAHPIVEEVLKYRQLEKLRSTYADGLFEYIAPDNKIYTTFNQVITSTGRLSSTEPNLQNIPIRMELGRMIRKAFIPTSDDYTFIDADYSQIELRVMAHMSKDKLLIDGYSKGEDIHKLTASQVFDVPLDEVTKEQRSAAKAVNFGIIYGISAFGLSEDISISKKEADQYIKNYFKKYSRVEEYLNELVKMAEETGVATTLYGRQRKIDELKESNFMKREFGKRIAKNTPIQGTAADIMKIAMVNFNNRIEKEKIDAKIILQVHDELLVEVRKEDKENAIKMLKEEMENAAKLDVPLISEVSSGSTWYETK